MYICEACGTDISIHALREEGDQAPCTSILFFYYFYPRPPRGGRHFTKESAEAEAKISIHALREEGDNVSCKYRQADENFYPRPPRGGRPGVVCSSSTLMIFLSTPSARRATAERDPGHRRQPISIHALREEGDRPQAQHLYGVGNFYPRPPRGGRPGSLLRRYKHE